MLQVFNFVRVSFMMEDNKFSKPFQSVQCTLNGKSFHKKCVSVITQAWNRVA